MEKESFGQYARRLRLSNKLGLREAARLMGLSAAYLSQVENDDVPPSPRLMTAMARVYQHPLANIQSVAQQAGIIQRAIPPAKQSMEELRSLYRVGGMFTAEEVESMIRHTLRSRGVSEQEIEIELARLRADLPRIQGGDALFAAEIKPRCLSKKDISKRAYSILENNGFSPKDYEPPTRIEIIVENEEGVSYRIAPLPSANGSAVVLGRSRWNAGMREITINKDLADSNRESDLHRFRFTLGHEFFHVLEHLQLPSAGGHLHRATEGQTGFVDTLTYRRSAAERSLDRWVRKDGSSRGLATAEDWREWQCNYFASAILMPEWALRQTFTESFDAECVYLQPGEKTREIALRIASENLPGSNCARSISQTFGVSRQAMAIRLLELGFVREVNG